MYGYKKRHIDKCNRPESSEVNLHLKGHLIFEKDAKANQWMAFSTNGTGTTRYPC